MDVEFAIQLENWMEQKHMIYLLRQKKMRTVQKQALLIKIMTWLVKVMKCLRRRQRVEERWQKLRMRHLLVLEASDMRLTLAQCHPLNELSHSALVLLHFHYYSIG
jgi:hypothetical protein